MLNTGFHIRKMEDADLEQVLELCQEVGFSMQLEKLQSRFKSLNDLSEHICVVAQNGPLILGMAHGSLTESLLGENSTVVDALMVRTNYRKLGVGQALVKCVTDWAQEQGCSDVSFRMNESRDTLNAFYESCGFSRLNASYNFVKNLPFQPRL